MFGLTQEEFDQYYPLLIDYKQIFYESFTTDKDFVENYLPSKLWRLNNLYTIIDKHGDKIPFVMNTSQHKVYAALIQHNRLIILKSRQQGISTFWLINFLDDAIFMENLNVGLMAQGADETQTLLERVKFSWDNLDAEIKQFLGVNNDKDNSKAFSFTNNSTIFIRTSFRSATLHRLHISELGKIANKYPEKAKETNTGTLQTIGRSGIVAIESTAEGDNMFKQKWDKAYDHSGPYAYKDLKAVFLSWLEDPDCHSDVPQIILPRHETYFNELEKELGVTISLSQKNFYIMQERELSDSDEKDIHQEYPSTPQEAFSAIRDGAYYAKQVRKHIIIPKRVITDLYDRNLATEVVIDLGMNDTFVMGFWQYSEGFERLVHDYTNSGEGLEHYVTYADKWAAKNDADLDLWIAPHDIRVRELGTGRGRDFRLRELGVNKLQILPKAKISDGIEAVRRMLTTMYIDAQCEYTFTCLKNYSKEWDERRQNWKDRPLHDEHSHGADMVRARAMSKPRYRVKDHKRISKPRGKPRARRIRGLAI